MTQPSAAALTLTFLLALGAPAVAQGPAPTAPPAAQAADSTTVAARFAVQQARHAADGYAPVAALPARTGTLPVGGEGTLTLTFPEPGRYRVFGVCDRHCGDLDLLLLDRRDNEVARDVELDAAPFVDVSVTLPGEAYTLAVGMFGCEAANCSYAVGILRNTLSPAQQAARQAQALQAVLAAQAERHRVGPDAFVALPGQPTILGTVRPGEEVRHALNLGQPGRYRVYAACAEGCGDLDLRVLSPDGDPLGSDVALDATPFVDFDVAAPGGRYTAEVIGAACQGDCRYALAVLRSPLSAEQRQQAQSQALLRDFERQRQRHAAEGYAPLLGPLSGAFSGRSDLELVLPTPGRYRIYAVCDQACRDLDLYVLRGAQEVASDVALDSTPYVELTSTAPNQAHTVRLQVVGCEAPTCRYHLGVSRR